MASESGGGGSSKSTRSMPKNTPIGYQGVGGNTKQQIENIHGAHDRQERERRDKIDEQVWHADQVAFARTQGSRAFAGAEAKGSGISTNIRDKERITREMEGSHGKPSVWPEGPFPMSEATASAKVHHDELTDALADAIVGSILLYQITKNTVRGATRIVTGKPNDNDGRDRYGFRAYSDDHPAPSGDVFRAGTVTPGGPQFDARSQEARRAKSRDGWKRSMGDMHDATTKYGTEEDPGWTN